MVILCLTTHCVIKFQIVLPCVIKNVLCLIEFRYLLFACVYSHGLCTMHTCLRTCVFKAVRHKHDNIVPLPLPLFISFEGTENCSHEESS